MEKCKGPFCQNPFCDDLYHPRRSVERTEQVKNSNTQFLKGFKKGWSGCEDALLEFYKTEWSPTNAGQRAAKIFIKAFKEWQKAQ